jgi:hypothetical protein
MDLLLLQEFKEINAKWLQLGHLDGSLKDQFNELSDRFIDALELALPFEFSDGTKHHRVEKLGALASQGFYFSRDRGYPDHFAYWEDIENISSVREG